MPLGLCPGDDQFSTRRHDSVAWSPRRRFPFRARSGEGAVTKHEVRHADHQQNDAADDGDPRHHPHRRGVRVYLEQCQAGEKRHDRRPQVSQDRPFVGQRVPLDSQPVSFYGQLVEARRSCYMSVIQRVLLAVLWGWEGWCPAARSRTPPTLPACRGV